MDIFSTVAILVVISLAAWLWLRHKSNASQQAERQLLRICFGSTSQVERLISGEMTRAPGITRSEAAARAVLRYQRDNH